VCTRGAHRASADGRSTSPLGERALTSVPPQTHSGDDYWSVISPHWMELNEAWDLGPDVFLNRLRLLPVRCQHLYTSHWCHSEVTNGGFYQFFFNATGILAPEAVSGFRALGIAELAEILTGAIRYFGPNYPRRRELRLDSLGPFQHPNRDAVEFFKPFDRAFYDWCDTPRDRWERTADSYARSA